MTDKMKSEFILFTPKPPPKWIDISIDFDIPPDWGEVPKPAPEHEDMVTQYNRQDEE